MIAIGFTPSDSLRSEFDGLEPMRVPLPRRLYTEGNCYYTGYRMAANSRFAVAVHALAVLACHPGERPTSRRIAESVTTNPVVIRRLLCALSRAGLVESSHGAKGGFRLARPAARITLRDVYQALEDGGGGFFARHEKSNESCPVACRMASILDGVFARVKAKALPELGRTTLAHVASQVRA